MDVIGRYPWPGNVRELRNILERALIHSRGESEIGVTHLAAEVRGIVNDAALPHVSQSLAMVERGHIERTLRAHGANRTRAARELGISRATLIKKIREYELGERGAALAEVDRHMRRRRRGAHAGVAPGHREPAVGDDFLVLARHRVHVAVRPDAYDTDVMKKYVADFPQAAVARDQLKVSVAELSTHENQRVTKALNDGLQAALTGTKSPEQAMKDAQVEAERILRSYR